MIAGNSLLVGMQNLEHDSMCCMRHVFQVSDCRCARWLRWCYVFVQLRFDEGFDEASSTHTPEQLPEWACA